MYMVMHNMYLVLECGTSTLYNDVAACLGSTERVGCHTRILAAVDKAADGHLEGTNAEHVLDLILVPAPDLLSVLPP